MIREPVVVPPASPHHSWPSPQLSVPCQLPSLRPFVVSRPPFAPSHVLSFQDASEHRAVYSLVSLWRSLSYYSWLLSDVIHLQMRSFDLHDLASRHACCDLLHEQREI